MNNQPNLSFLSSSFDLSNTFSARLCPDECLARPGIGITITSNSNASSNNLSDSRPPEKIDLPEQNDEIFQFNDTLESIVQSCLYCNNQSKISQEMSTRHPCDDTTGCNHLPFHRNKSTPKKSKNLLQISLTQNDTCSKFQHKEHLACSNAVSQKATKKTRIKWNEDLHKKFVESIHRLGGARKATPKGVLKLMNCEGVTISHVKSHLQKYRSCRQHILEETMDPCLGINTEQLDKKTGVQIVQVLRLQLDIQRHLHEQIESQNKLQIQIEEQAKQLNTMIQSQSKTNDTCSHNASRNRLP